MHPNAPLCAVPGDSSVPTVSCEALCSASTTVDDLNRSCFCVAVEPDALRDSLAATMAAHGLSVDLAETHPHLFATLPVYLSELHVEAIGRVAISIEAAVARPRFQATVLGWAPGTAKFDPGSPGG